MAYYVTAFTECHALRPLQSREWGVDVQGEELCIPLHSQYRMGNVVKRVWVAVQVRIRFPILVVNKRGLEKGRGLSDIDCGWRVGYERTAFCIANVASWYVRMAATFWR